jgi:hypothetical protein
MKRHTYSRRFVRMYHRCLWLYSPAFSKGIVRSSCKQCIQPFSGRQGGFVLAGRSLRTIEDCESTTIEMVGMAWLV